MAKSCNIKRSFAGFQGVVDKESTINFNCVNRWKIVLWFLYERGGGIFFVVMRK